MAGVPSGAAPTPSDYLLDLMAFLKSTFSVFTNLPVSKAAAVKEKSTRIVKRAVCVWPSSSHEDRSRVRSDTFKMADVLSYPFKAGFYVQWMSMRIAAC